MLLDVGVVIATYHLIKLLSELQEQQQLGVQVPGLQQ